MIRMGTLASLCDQLLCVRFLAVSAARDDKNARKAVDLPTAKAAARRELMI